jgi:PAS domain S-box-containing protein
LIETTESAKISATSNKAGLRRIVGITIGDRPAARACCCPGVDAMKTALPENEAERLNALRRYQILDTPPEPAFDRIAEMAANFFHVPMAGLSLVDEDRVWFKSRVGINAHQTARDAGLCSTAMLSQGVFHLRDAAHDERATAHSLVPDLGIRFYAGAPLRTEQGLNLGTVWVLDQKPRELAPEEAEMLRTLAALAMNQMELRLYAEKVARLERAERTIGEQLREANERLTRSEERFRDLFDEAPIAYVHQRIDTRIIRANRTAMKILGVKPGEIEGMIGSSFIADTPEAQRRLRDALSLDGKWDGQQRSRARTAPQGRRQALIGQVVGSAVPGGWLYAQHVHGHHRSGADGAGDGTPQGSERLLAR